MADKKLTPLILVNQAATPSTPNSGEQKIYGKVDGKMYALNSDGVETEITNAGGGGGGPQNLFIQQSAPTAAFPFIWFETDSNGKVIDIKQST
jgi:hypothetical protein